MLEIVNKIFKGKSFHVLFVFFNLKKVKVIIDGFHSYSVTANGCFNVFRKLRVFEWWKEWEKERERGNGKEREKERERMIKKERENDKERNRERGGMIKRKRVWMIKKEIERII